MYCALISLIQDNIYIFLPLYLIVIAFQLSMIRTDYVWCHYYRCNYQEKDVTKLCCRRHQQIFKQMLLKAEKKPLFHSVLMSSVRRSLKFATVCISFKTEIKAYRSRNQACETAKQRSSTLRTDRSRYVSTSNALLQKCSCIHL